MIMSLFIVAKMFRAQNKYSRVTGYIADFCKGRSVGIFYFFSFLIFFNIKVEFLLHIWAYIRVGKIVSQTGIGLPNEEDYLSSIKDF